MKSGKQDYRALTHTVLVIGLYELLGNSTTYPIEPPGPSKSVCLSALNIKTHDGNYIDLFILKNINCCVFFLTFPEYPERTTDHGQATGKLYHLRLRVECTLCCNLQSRARIHAVLVIGLYEGHFFWHFKFCTISLFLYEFFSSWYIFSLKYMQFSKIQCTIALIIAMKRILKNRNESEILM
jgi:hypothetical protein